ncbi:aspartate kinase [Mucilaginibacter psychrotolerans]|uniref:aspartate kinase n=1 Tax=Mucilaginibacter psychrotolerans TaxID=1524096 RepID=A0A4Y8S7J3_9SPHI|nr:aspartate kinase [Mucilaginibacter psychrotolerans]TFF34581.1 aspartate kinase [Mucilaginibacter psychrotolerans]
MLTVEKIGGTSMSALKEVIDNIILYDRSGETLYNRVFVVSAFSGVTNLLLENKKSKAPGVYQKLARREDFRSELASVAEYLKTLNQQYEYLGLDRNEADQVVDAEMKTALTYLDSAVTMLASGYLNEGILLAAREILASLGESHSAYVLASILQARGLNARLVDLAGTSDSRPLSITERIKDAFQDIDLKSCIVIATGYTKGTEGIMREFDRGYSEVTFSRIAEILKPEEAIIHKEYHLSTADPGLVGLDNVKPVGNTNYDIADQLADVGMEAIHPKASKPLEMAGIHLRIKNTFQPEHPGTLITKDYISKLKRIEVITGTDQQLLIDIYDPLMTGNVGSDLAIMQCFADYGISYTFKATSANSISIVIWESDLDEALIAALRKKFERVTTHPIAMVCLLGSNMDQPGLLANATAALARAEVSVIAIGMASGRVNIQFAVDREQFKAAITALNKAVG